MTELDKALTALAMDNIAKAYEQALGKAGSLSDALELLNAWSIDEVRETAHNWVGKACTIAAELGVEETDVEQAMFKLRSQSFNVVRLWGHFFSSGILARMEAYEVGA